MIHFLRFQCDGCHEAECLDKVFELKRGHQSPVDKFPAGEDFYGIMEFFLIEGLIHRADSSHNVLRMQAAREYLFFIL